MGQDPSTLHVRRAAKTRIRQDFLRFLGLLLLIVCRVHAEEPEPGKIPLQEPQTLLAPVQLIPVEEATLSAAIPSAAIHSTAISSAAISEVTPVSAPPVRLAPEPLPQHATKAKQITNSVDGIRPASFMQLTPGSSTREDVLEKLGDPLETTASEDEEKLGFKVGPFPSVQVTLSDKVVSSIVIHLASPSLRADVVKELKLEEFQAVIIHDDAGRTLGEVYPERALMFAYQGEAAGDGARAVGQVVLERISVEPFLLRSEQAAPEQIGKRLSDLRVVQQLLPNDAEAYALAARLDQQCGRIAAALEAARTAVDLDAEKTEYRILLADLRRQAGESEQALTMIQTALQDGKLSSLDQAEGRILYGRLLAARPNFDHKQAMQETVSAIKLAAAQTSLEEPAQRRRARQLLIRAELSLAEILAYGPWTQKHQVVPQWLASAEKAANEHIEKDDVSHAILLSVYSASLHCLLALEGQGSPTKIADTAIHLGRDLIAESEDEQYQAVVEWQLGTGLWYAAQVEHAQGHPEEALQLANNAEALMAAAGKLRSGSPETTHHLAQLHFLMGSIHAVHKRDYASATRWYDKTLPQLAELYPDSLHDDSGLVGEQLVSIGISLWESGRRNKAVSITEQGTALIIRAVEDGTFKERALAIPYHNLAQMHRELGNEEQAALMAKKASQYEPPASDAKKRR